MTRHTVKEMGCTVCGSRFAMVFGAMVNPADTLCDACILGLWDGAVDRSALSERVRPRMGMTPDVLVEAILDRAARLHDVVASREELVQLLANRTDARG